ncbi:hypothetical protein ACI65C_005780 [Semiaphis heraclei]
MRTERVATGKNATDGNSRTTAGSGTNAIVVRQQKPGSRRPQLVSGSGSGYSVPVCHLPPNSSPPSPTTCRCGCRSVAWWQMLSPLTALFTGPEQWHSALLLCGGCTIPRENKSEIIIKSVNTEVNSEQSVDLSSVDSEKRSTIMQDRLSGLALISIEQETAREVEFENLIDMFAEAKARKKKF